MNIIDKIILGRISSLLNDLSLVSVDAITELDRKQKSNVVSDFTTSDELSSDILKRIANIQMEITLLKGLLSDEIDINKV